MEASQAGLAGSGTGGDGQSNGEGAAATQGPDTAALTEQLQSLQGGQEEMRNFLLSNPWAQQPEGEADESAGELDLSFLDADEPGFDPATIASRLGDVINQAAETRAQSLISEQISPLQTQVQEMRQEAMIEQLVAELPEIGTPEVGPQVVQHAQTLVESYGWPKELAGDPRFWRMAYLSGRAFDQAQQEEGAETPAAAHLEGGSGARPGGAQQVDLGDQIIGAAQGGSRVLPFG